MPKVFLRFTDSELGGEIWIDAERIAFVRTLGKVTFIHLAGVGVPATVTEDPSTVIERMNEAVQKIARAAQ